jgi:CRISPR/Cas system CMR subunit Cmr4 (Cas7 group RAMP superfamily)
MKTLNRQTIIAEELIRSFVRKRLEVKIQERKDQSDKLRKAIRTLIEAETGTEEPSTFTGINVLADLLKNIIPTISDDYKMLTTSSEQRESFRNHIIHAVQNSIRPIEANTQAEDVAEALIYELDKELLAEKIEVSVEPDGSEIGKEGEFIDIDDSTSEEEDFITLADQNETGRNFAAETFKSVEKQIVDAYDMLADDEDQELFYDYLITNLLMYFDKFEDELANELPDVTTPEYEKNKDNLDSEVETDELNSEDAEEEFDLDL